MATFPDSPSEVEVLGIPISTRNLPDSIAQTSAWAVGGERSRTVTFSNAHMLALACRDDEFGNLLRGMDMNCADGAPVMLTARMFCRAKGLTRVSGPDFLLHFCRETAHLGLRHYFLGGGPGVAKKAATALMRECPGMQTAGTYSPPFHAMTEYEMQDCCQTIVESGANIVWVGLGCPKQEVWMSRCRSLLPGMVILGVGQAFDIYAGEVSRAPLFMREWGLEWLYRLAQEPRRLWKRYMIYNTAFLISVISHHVLASWKKGSYTSVKSRK